MSTDRTPLLLGTGLGMIGVAFLLLTQPYSVPAPWSKYDAPAHRYLAAALRQDTLAIRELSTTRQPVTWAVHTREGQGGALLAWANSSRAFTAFSRGDTAEVWYDSATEACPLRLTFVGVRHPKLMAVYARCYSHRGWPSDSSVISIRR